MKHLWQTAGLCENKFTEARCCKCGKQECSGADFCDTEKQAEFWKRINKLTNCSVSGKSGICKFPVLNDDAIMGKGSRTIVGSNIID